MYGQQQNKEESLKLSLYMAFTLDFIWTWEIKFCTMVAKLTLLLLPIFQEFSTLAEVARDDNGEFIQVWTKLHELCSPLLAEAAAILWALQIALGEKWDRIIVERGCKNLYWLTSGYEFRKKSKCTGPSPP